jgi:septal ring factor EnvC (AmiA/AmiB activator)
MSVVDEALTEYTASLVQQALDAKTNLADVLAEQNKAAETARNERSQAEAAIKKAQEDRAALNAEAKALKEQRRELEATRREVIANGAAATDTVAGVSDKAKS